MVMLRNDNRDRITDYLSHVASSKEKEKRNKKITGRINGDTLLSVVIEADPRMTNTMEETGYIHVRECMRISAVQCRCA